MKLQDMDKESIEVRIKEQKQLYRELQKQIKIEKIKLINILAIVISIYLLALIFYLYIV